MSQFEDNNKIPPDMSPDKSSDINSDMAANLPSEMDPDLSSDGSMQMNPEAEKTMSLLGGVANFDDGGDGYDEFSGTGESAGSKLLSHGTLVIGLILVIGVGTLYGMRLTQRDISSTLDPVVAAKIEGFLVKTSNPLAMDASDPLRQENIKSLIEDTDDILSTFSADPTENQVPIEYVKKNPFLLQLFKAKQEVKADPGAGADERREQDRRNRIARLKKELDGLQIQSVMWGRNPVAIINSELYQAGQQVGSFTITKVNQLSVELAADGNHFVLEMERQNGGQSPRQRLGRN